MWFILRLASAVLLVAAIVLATIDAIRSVSLSLAALTPMRDIALMAGDGGLAFVRLLEPATPAFWQPAARRFMELPAFAILLVAALLLLWPGIGPRPGVFGQRLETPQAGEA